MAGVVTVGGGERGSSLYRLLEGGQGRLGFAPVAHLLTDRQAARGSVAPLGAKRSPRLSMCQIASESRRARSICATLAPRLFADPRFRLRAPLAVDGVGAGVRGGFDECPAQVARSLFAERAAQVALTGSVDARAVPSGRSSATEAAFLVLRPTRVSSSPVASSSQPAGRPHDSPRGSGSTFRFEECEAGS